MKEKYKTDTIKYQFNMALTEKEFSFLYGIVRGFQVTETKVQDFVIDNLTKKLFDVFSHHAKIIYDKDLEKVNNDIDTNAKYMFNVLQVGNNDFVKYILDKLPNIINYGEYSFDLHIFMNSKTEIRIGYLLCDCPVEEDLYTWPNPFFDNSNKGFLYLVEGIEDTTDLIDGVNEVVHFLEVNKLYSQPKTN